MRILKALNLLINGGQTNFSLDCGEMLSTYCHRSGTESNLKLKMASQFPFGMTVGLVLPLLNFCFPISMLAAVDKMELWLPFSTEGGEFEAFELLL